MRLLLFDANVLIDYFDADPSVFPSIRNSVGAIYVVSIVLAEVDQIDASQTADLGLKVFEPEFAMLSAAATGCEKLSFQDKLCLMVARAANMTCVTNDTALRTRCTDQFARRVARSSTTGTTNSPAAQGVKRFIPIAGFG